MSSAVWGPDIGSLWWRTSAHVRKPIDKFTSVKVSGGKFLTGTLTVAASYNATWMQEFLSVGTDPVNQAVEFYYRDTSAPLFIGALIGAERTFGDGAPDGEVTLTFEHMWAHMLRRIIMQSPGNDGSKISASLVAIEADILAQNMMRDAIGLARAGGGVFATAPPYTLTVDRGDSDQFGPWILTVASAHSPALSSDTQFWDYQDGRNYLDTLLDLGERSDIAYTFSETGTAGTFVADSTGTYQRNDKTASVILSERWGTVRAYSHKIDYTGVANTWYLKFDGSGSSQSGKGWYQDSSASTIGIFEDTAAIPYVTSATTQTNTKNMLMGLYASAPTTIDVELTEYTGAKFNSSFGVRDKVRFQSGLFGVSADVLVVGYDIGINDQGEVSVGVTLDSPPRTITAQLRNATPLEGGRHGGGLLHQRDG